MPLPTSIILSSERLNTAKRCLGISEIFQLILECLLNEGYGHRRTVATLARTCRVFSDLALRALWSDLNGLRPLMNLLNPRRTPQMIHVNEQPAVRPVVCQLL